MKIQYFQTLLGLTTLSVAAPTISTQNSRLQSRDIPGQYIIRFKDNSSPESITASLSGSQVVIENVIQFGSFSAYAGSFSEKEIAEISALPNVLTVEPDQIVFEPPTDATELTERDLITQSNAPWHLGDVSHEVSGSTDYVHDDSAGEGQTVYVVDTGIRLSHEDLEGRAIFGFNAVTGSTVQNGTNSDDDGHGTHVAGIAVGGIHGVASKATVVDVKVFEGGSGSTSIGLAGYSWAVNDIVSKGAQNTSVINLSLSAETTQTLWDNAAIAAYDMGVVSVAAAGNNDGPAADHTPARVPQVITVGMTDPDRSRTSIIEGIYGSNWGPELDLFAPGRDIISTDSTSDTALRTRTGTSMASPLVAGLICYLRALEGGLGTPDEVIARLLELSHKDVVPNPNGSPNFLVYNGSGQ